MTRISDKVKQDRLRFIAHLLKRIYEVPSYSTFQTNAFKVIADVGLQKKAKEKGLFTEEWYHSDDQETQLKELTAFLFEYII